MRTFETLIAAATAAFDAGFTSEANRKEALADVTRAYERLMDDFRASLIRTHPANADGVRPAKFEALYWGVPAYPHQFKAKHAEMLADYADVVALAQDCAKLREAIRSAPLVEKAVAETHPLMARATSVFADLMAAAERRGDRFEAALDLGRRLEGLPVSVSGVYCRNSLGTTWVRFDWYLRGERTAFGIIAAAYDRLVREGVITEAA